MSSAVQDTPPKPTLGMPVRFYPQASMDESRVEVGIVTKIGQSTISICILGINATRSSVKHKDDVRLKRSIDQRQYGCWDFTEEWYERMSSDEYMLTTMAQLDDRLTGLMKTCDIPDTGKTPQASANKVKAENFGRLRRRAHELGVPDVVFKSSQQLQEAIEDAEESLIQSQMQIEESRKKARAPQADSEMSDEERRREILARAQNNPEAVTLARRQQASVANQGPSEDNRKPVSPATPPPVAALEDHGDL